MSSLRFFTLAGIAILVSAVSVSVASAADLIIDTEDTNPVVINVPYDDVTVSVPVNVVNESHVGQRITEKGPDGLNVFDFSGKLEQSNGLFTNNGYVSTAILSGEANFTNNTSGAPKKPGIVGVAGVDWMEIAASSSVKVINNGSIGVYSTDINDRTGGLKQASGEVTNNSYISRLEISGGKVTNNKQISDVYQTGGVVVNLDWIKDITIDGPNAVFHNKVLYNDAGDAIKAGGISGGGGLILKSGTAVIDNFVNKIDMYEGGYLILNKDRKNRAVEVLNLYGGKISGNGAKITEFNILGKFESVYPAVLPPELSEATLFSATAASAASGFFFEVENLVFGAESETTLMVNSLIFGESMLFNVTGSISVEEGAIINVVFSEAVLEALANGEVNDFNLMDLFGIEAGSPVKSNLDWNTDVTYFAGSYSGDNRLDMNDTPWLTDLVVNAREPNNPNPTPEPATVLFLAVSALAGLPMSRRFRKKS